jgi:phosphatidylglycerophosphatase C
MTAHGHHKASHKIKMLLVGVVLCVGVGKPEPAAARQASWNALARNQAQRNKSLFQAKKKTWLRPVSPTSPAVPAALPVSAARRRAPVKLDPRARNTIKQLLRTGRRGPTTFDGDGTLWGGDVGEGFFRWMLKNRHYPAERIPALTRAWNAYKAGAFPGEQMYELMVTGMAGMKEAEVRDLATRYFDTKHQHRIYRPMAHMVEALDRLGMSPWVVSGSPYWVVAAGARHLGIPADRVIGLRTEVTPDGLLTGRVVRPVPWKKGKAQQLKLQGIHPVLAVGNSYGDIQMLRTASEVSLVVNPGPATLRHAESNGWTVHRYTRSDELSRRPLLPAPRPPAGLLPAAPAPAGLPVPAGN